MFERFTEKARRVIFFARYEASEFGSAYIESEHLLLGLLREGGDLFARPSDGPDQRIALRAAIHATRRAEAEPLSTSVDLPLAVECKRVLLHAHEESKRLKHDHIGVEHILLGILLEKNSTAAKLLSDQGWDADVYREKLAKSTPVESQRGPSSPSPAHAHAHAQEQYTVTKFAQEEATALGSPEVGVEHLLLGILRNRDSVAARLLLSRGITLDDLRAGLRQQQPPDASAPR
jgi:ATP-dependent Clp protease ATP-binding subunit ClpC